MAKLDYALVDSGNGQKLERFGDVVFIRPCAQAVWEPNFPELWKEADATFSREGKEGWSFRRPLPSSWNLPIDDLIFKISPTDFGHVGLFPEQRDSWQWIKKQVALRQKPRVLNLFAYSGGASLAAAQAGAEVCHLDASKGMVSWARENAQLSKLSQAPIRWIVDDVIKFLKRELRREQRYDGIILDPPTFGRGSQGEVFKIDEQIQPLLGACRSLLSEQPLFVLFSCHTPGYSPLVVHHLLSQMMKGVSGNVESGEMVLRGAQEVLPLPSGTFARWSS